MSTQKLVGENALSAIASDIKTAIGTKADASNTYTKSEVDTALGSKANSADVYNKSEIDTTMEGKADINGTYDLMTVGNAKQLKSNVGENDKAPYLFRTSGGSIDIGESEEDTLVGGTVAFNQLVKNGNFANNSNWSNASSSISISNNKCIVTPSSTNAYIYQEIIGIANHKYLAKYEIQSDIAIANTRVRLLKSGNTVQYSSSQSVSANAKGIIYNILAPNDSFDRFSIYPDYGGSSSEHTYNISNAILIDLTQMFGSTIADYIYSLEQGTAGAGVAWFKKLFPKPYYDYNVGELMSVKTSSHNLVGFNAWDEQWEIGKINFSTGQNLEGDDRIRSKNYIPVVPNTNYFYREGSDTSLTTGNVYYYDADKNFLYAQSGKGNSIFATPSDCHFIRIVAATDYGTAYKNDICINISWDGERNGEYEPYVEYNYPLDSDLELRGIPKLDANNKLYYDGDEYEDTGLVTRKFGYIEFDGSDDEDWTFTGTRFVCPISDMLSQASRTYVISNRGVFDASSTADGTIFGFNGSVYYYLSTETSLADFKTWLSNNHLQVVYPLATPTTEQADSYQNPQIVDDFGTEEYVDTRAVAIPVGHDTFYQANLRAKLEMVPDSPSGNGDYIVRQVNGQNEYVAFTKELPTLPSTDGTYTLKCTVSSGSATLSWVSE